jgi:pimeloyl-ACP methyl ester carboxylesterase
MSEPTMKQVNGDGLRIQLALWEGTDKPVLCAHGITANCRCWDVVANSLSPPYRVLAMDLRGRGGSDKPSTGYSLEHHMGDIRSLMADLGLDRVVLMGHSLGAFISLAFSARHPDLVDRLVLFDGGGKLSEEQMNHVFQGIQPALNRLGKVFPSADAYMEAMREAPFLHPWSPAIDTYYRYEIESVAGGVRTNIDPAHIQEEALNVRKVEPDTFYDKVSCPVLILRATQGLLSQKDLLLPEDVVTRMVEEIPNARRVDLEGLNHYGVVFQPSPDRDKALLSFLQE